MRLASWLFKMATPPFKFKTVEDKHGKFRRSYHPLDAKANFIVSNYLCGMFLSFLKKCLKKY